MPKIVPPGGVEHARIPPCADCAPLVDMMLRDLARRAGVTVETMAAMWGLDPPD